MSTEELGGMDPESLRSFRDETTAGDPATITVQGKPKVSASGEPRLRQAEGRRPKAEGLGIRRVSASGESRHQASLGIERGWQCPVCGAVYAPWVSECRHCGPKEKGAESTRAAWEVMDTAGDTLSNA